MGGDDDIFIEERVNLIKKKDIHDIYVYPILDIQVLIGGRV